MMKFATLLVEQQQRILLVTLNRPEVRNAINYQMMQDLRDLWLELNTNAKDLRCVILTGSGNKAFCAGADLKERYNLQVEVWLQQHKALQKAMLQMIDCPLPIIAAVNGAAFGGGLELVLASDFAYAVETAIFSQSETKLGLIPGAMGTQNLPRAGGSRRAKELIFTAASFSAEQAYRWNIINKTCSKEELLSEVLTTAQKICEMAPLAIAQAKKSINISQAVDLKTGYLFEIEAYNRLLPSKDREEGIAAFNEKRIPKFVGR